jgi:hypothetical protein
LWDCNRDREREREREREISFANGERGTPWVISRENNYNSEKECDAGRCAVIERHIIYKFCWMPEGDPIRGMYCI